MPVCFLGIGSNLGERRKYIKLAIKRIGSLKNTKVLKISSIIETAPVGGPLGQNKFLNAVIKIKTNFSAEILLKKLAQIEADLDRIKTVLNGPRTIDLDILLYGDQVIDTKRLKVPHPRMIRRDFVLRPLFEVI